MAVIKPSLVIGAGGSGYWILSLLKRQLYINYGLNIDESKEVKFLLVDTLSEDKFETEYQEHIKSIGEKFAINRKEYLHLGEARGGFFNWANQEKNYKDPLYQWFRRKLFIENYTAEANWRLNEGAAQLRQFGRMAFFFNKNRIKQAIINLLDEIKEIARDSTIPVWLFGSFAGGTGAGMMLDMAILLKLISDQKKIAIRNIGGIVLPEVYKDTLKTSEAQGYAAFRELSRFLSSTKEMHRAKIDNQDCKHMVLFEGPEKFYHNKSIFDNIIYFNEECQSDEARKNYFNKVTDGLTVFFDYSGAQEFFNEVINHKENRVTSISTYKIFVPINLYVQLFTATFLKDEIDKLFPNAKDSTILLPEEDRKAEINRDTENFLNNLSPYFLELSKLVEDDKKALDYTQKHILGKPLIIFNDLFGYSTPERFFGKEVESPNYKVKLERLFKNIFEDEKAMAVEALKAYIKGRRANERDYSLENFLAEFKSNIDKKYASYDSIFKKENEDRVLIKNNILNRFKSKLKDYIKNDLSQSAVPDIYYFLKKLTMVMQGDEAAGGIKNVLQRIVKKEFDSRRPDMESDNNKMAGNFLKINLVKEKKVLGILSKESEDYEGAVQLMKEYLSQKTRFLFFEQSGNLISLLMEIHDEFSGYVWTRLLKNLIDKNDEISIARSSIKNKLNNQINDIRSVMKGGVGKASSIGLLGTEEEAKKYEKYLLDNIFAEKPYASLKAVFDPQEEKFLVEYKDSDQKTWYDNQDIEISIDKKITMWMKMIDDVRHKIEDSRLPRYEGIMHYLKWAREEYRQYKDDKLFVNDLEKKLISAHKEFIKLPDNTPKRYRLIYGDKNAGQFNLEKELRDLKLSLEKGVGNAVSDPSDKDSKIDFGDKNSLIFLAYSNDILPESIEVLNSMKEKYVKEIVSESALDWRANVYHNYKCDWEIWEMERVLPDFKTRSVHSLTHGAFYWVLEEEEKIKLFVHCAAAGVIREEDSILQKRYWVCGPRATNLESVSEMTSTRSYSLTDENQTSDIFTALVNFAVTQREVGRIDKIDFEKVRRHLTETLKNDKQQGRTFNEIRDQYVADNEWIREYNKSIDIDDYEGHKNLFLARIFWYYLKEEHKLEKK